MVASLLIVPLLLITFLMLMAAVAIVIRGVIRRRRWVEEPSCGRCRYAVEGLDVMRCPECGADLEEVGVLTPGMVRPLGPRTCVLAWTLALPMPAFLLSLLAWAVLPSTYLSHSRLQLTPTDPAAPYQAAVIDFVGDGSRLDRDHDRATITLTMNDGTTSRALDVDLDTFRYRTERPDGGWRASEDALDEAVVEGWLAGLCGRDPAGDRAAEATELFARIDTMATGHPGAAGPAFTGATFSGTVTMISRDWFWPAAAVTWLVTWLGGGLLLARTVARRHAAS